MNQIKQGDVNNQPEIRVDYIEATSQSSTNTIGSVSSGWAWNYAIDYKLALILICLNLIFFHPGRTLFYLGLLMCFSFSYLHFHIQNTDNLKKFNEYVFNRRKKYANTNGFIKIDCYLESMVENDFLLSDSSQSLYKQQFDQPSLSDLSIKPALTGSYLIDDEIHKIIELIMRDYIDIWYKNEISSKNDFKKSIRSCIYSAIRYMNSCLKEIDWEQFIMNILAHNLVFQMRMFKKAKEKRSKLNQDNTVLKNEILKAISELSENNASNSNSTLLANQAQNDRKKILINDLLNNTSFLAAAHTAAGQHENNLIDLFFDLEAEREKGICRDDISYNSSEKESDLLQEISEIICYSLLPQTAFNCFPLRCLLREILSKHLIKITVDNLTDPDYINQTILYVFQDQVAPKTENFLIALSHSESLDELRELGNKIDEEILKTRSYDKGGTNDHEIKQRLSSLQYIKRKIESYILNLFKINNKMKDSPKTKSEMSQNDIFLFNQQLDMLDFNVVCHNETIQHCFIEFMGKQSVQNLISFYLNADMYRQFAVKELERCNNADKTEVKKVLKDFANGLINSYLLSANNFKSSNPNDEGEPANISNRIFYKPELAKTIERLDKFEFVDETLLDDLQIKIFQLMKQKYYPDFKNYAEFKKILHKNDLLFKLTVTNVSPDWSTSGEMYSQKEDSSPGFDLNEDDDFTSSLQHTGIADSLIDEESLIIIDDGQFVDRISQSSIDSISYSEGSNKSNSPQVPRKSMEIEFLLSAVITSSGVCNELNAKYAIYIIDVTKLYPLNPGFNEYWQTYRRFNDFYDLHLTIKKKFPSLSNFSLPGKSFRNSLSDEFLEKRKSELNRYLQTLCNPDIIANNPKLMELLLQFLENKPWDTTQTNFKRRVDSLFTPVLSSVQNIQSSINENVIGMVKGISDNFNPVVSSFSKNVVPTANTGSTNHETVLPQQALPVNSNGNSKRQIDRRDLVAIDKTILNPDDMQSNNFPVRVLLMLIDEIFDLKEKNQWIRQSLMLIVKTFMKNFKGDSMNKKIKEQIADYLSEEYLARYFKNFRKRIWPKGHLAEQKVERSNSIKEVTKILAKTKLLGTVSDDLRHILGNDATRRGILEVFDLFQYRALNKRLLHTLAENLLASFFQANNSPDLYCSANTLKNHSINLSPHLQYHSNIQNSSLIQLIKSHLSKSSRVKPEWKLINNNMNVKRSNNIKLDNDNLPNQLKVSPRTSNLSLANLTADKKNQKKYLQTNENEESSPLSVTSIVKSKSFY